MNWKKILLIVSLFLIGIQGIYAGAQNIPDISAFLRNTSVFYTIYQIGLPIIIGLIFVVLGILVILNKHWIKIPLLIILGLFFLYSVYELINSMVLLPKIIEPSLIKIMKWQVYLMIEYSILSLISFILTLFVFKRD